MKRIKLKKNKKNKDRKENIKTDRFQLGKRLLTNAVKVVSLNDEDRLHIGDMAVFVLTEDGQGDSIRTETRRLNESDFEDVAQ